MASMPNCPENYQPLLDVRQTEAAIRQIKEFFQVNLTLATFLAKIVLR